MRPRAKTILRLFLIITIASVAGCTFGPRYVKPGIELPEKFDQVNEEESVSVGEVAEISQNLVWEAFKDPALDALLLRAQQENKSIGQAMARLQETRALRGLSVFSLFPTVTASGSMNEATYSDLDPLIPADVGGVETYDAGFDATWEIDLFGSLRQQYRAISGEAKANAYALRAARLSVNAEVAQAYFALRGAQQRLSILSQNIENLKSTSDILDVLQREGRGTALELAQNRSLTLQSQAQLPTIEAEITQHEQRLAVLTAQPVANIRSVLKETENRALTLPSLITVGTPTEWIKRRPDVLAAEQQFVAANARVGANVADYFPTLNLVGNFGWTAQSASGLGDRDAERWDYGPTLTWNFLNLGRIRQNVRAAEASADASALAYQESVLLALEDTENALAQYRASNQSWQRLEAAANQSRIARDLAKLRYENGAIDFLRLLDAERTLLSIEDANVQAKTRHTTSLALLYKSLAGDFAEEE